LEGHPTHNNLCNLYGSSFLQPSIMAENLGFSDGRFLQKNLGFSVGFGYRNNTSLQYCK